MPDTLHDIPFTKEFVVALIFVRDSACDDDGDEMMSDGDGYASRNT